MCQDGRYCVIGGDKLTLPQFWCNLAVGWRNLHESREPLCDCFAWSFAVCGDFFEVAVWSFGIRSLRQHTYPLRPACKGRCPMSFVRPRLPQPAQQRYPAPDGLARGRPDGEHSVGGATVSVQESVLSP